MPHFLASSHRVQAAAAAVAGAQHGVIGTAQLHRCGLGSTGIRDWTQAGRLHRVHRGVYAVGHPGLGVEGQWMAAVLALGEGAVLSHASAAMLWRMLEARLGIVHVTVPGFGGRARRRGLRIHRSSTLRPRHITHRGRIPVTSPARTLADLRRGAPGPYRRALRQAEYLGLPTGGPPEADGTRSGLESRFLAFCHRHDLPIPEVNVRLGPYTVDFLWRAERVIVETDSFRTHGGALAFEEDRRRDLWLKARGYEVVRVTDQALTADPEGTASALRAILRASRRA
jgi:Protein of unknown function (DUF559)/Transcriptional regulator, AbiEi antitoxin